ncbi:MAG TPA: hypothetical protein VFH09_02195 [Nitrososphaera sp.]|nr:hypothetical protein [Nitrososphaera sp.]
MKTTLTAAIVAAFAILGGIFLNTSPGLATPNLAEGTETATSGLSTETGGNITGTHQGDHNHKWGMISSIQNDEQGQPAWIVAGHWVMEMAPQNDTGTSNTTSSISNITAFYATLHMVRFNGSAMHTHEVSNFTQVGDATFDSSKNSTTITGTATITMREGPVPNVQMTIEIAEDKVIAISPDPTPLQNHFGDTPIYGIVASPEVKEQLKRMYDDRTGGGEGTGYNSTGI